MTGTTDGKADTATALPTNLTLRPDGTFARRGATRPGDSVVTLAVSDGVAAPVTQVVTFRAVTR